MSIKLWRWNATTGYWSIERGCEALNADEWLRVYQDDEPGAIFQLGEKRPFSLNGRKGPAPATPALFPRKVA
jgi:hypothetical protein